MEIRGNQRGKVRQYHIPPQPQLLPFLKKVTQERKSYGS